MYTSIYISIFTYLPIYIFICNIYIHVYLYIYIYRLTREAESELESVHPPKETFHRLWPSHRPTAAEQSGLKVLCSY